MAGIRHIVGKGRMAGKGHIAGNIARNGYVAGKGRTVDQIWKRRTRWN